MKKLITFLCLGLCINYTYSQNPLESLNFDGTNDYVSANLPTIFNDITNNDFTIETWIKPTASQTQRVFFAQLNTTEFVSILLNPSNVPYFYVYNGGVNGINSSGSLNNGQWHHIAFTWVASTQTSNIYIDGVLQNGGAPGSSSTGNNNAMTIGARTDGSQPFAGELDEFRIWDYARSECDINSSLNSEFTTSQPNFVAYYNFNQGTPGGNNAGVTTLPDFTTNYDGTLQNFTLSGATSNWVSSNANINSVSQNSGPTNGIDTQSSCDDFTWIDGNTYTQSNNTATFTITGGAANGCDSTVTLDLTINNATTGTDSQVACDDFTWIDGNTYTQSNNTATFTIVGGAANGCDSIVTLDLTINSASTGTDTQIACDDFTWIDGNTYTQSNNTATFTIVGGAANGCDSTVTLDLTIDQPNLSINVGEASLEAVFDANYQYQWLDCNDAFAPINGANSSSFNPNSNGTYTVEINNGNCTDTSSCENFTTVGLEENILSNISLYPNPNDGHFYLNFGQTLTEVSVQITDLQGRVIESVVLNNVNTYEFNLNTSAGTYVIEVTSESFKQALRVVKQ